MEQATWLKMQRKLFAVMRLCSPVVLSYLDAGFDPRCRGNDFLLACCCCCLLLLLKRVAHPWPLKGGVKPRKGKHSSVITFAIWGLSRLELGPSWVLVLRNALEIMADERPLAFQRCLNSQYDCPETRLKNGSFSPQNGQLRGTTEWYTPH